MADVTFQRKDHEKACKVWTLINDACEGQVAVKDGQEKYLPKPKLYTDDEYTQYILRAIYYNTPGRTLDISVGAAFKKKGTLETKLKNIDVDVDGAGVTIYQQSQAVSEAVMKTGRHCLFTDYPVIDQKLSKADQDKLNIKPKIIEIDACRVKNWRFDVANGLLRLALVTIQESVEETTADGFGIDIIEQYRALKLVDGQYIQELWQKGGDNHDGAWELKETLYPTDGSGNAWDVIPFTFVGSKSNDADIDKAPMFDLAVLAIAHYRNSADYQESCFLVGQPQVTMTGMTQSWVDENYPDGIVFGSRSALTGPEGSSIGLLQVSPNSMAKESMELLEKQMSTLGARLLTKGEAVKTATEAQGDSESEHSVLSLVAENVSSAYTQHLRWCERYMKMNEEAEYKINTDFLSAKLDAATLQIYMGMVQAGKMPESDFFELLRKAGAVDTEKTDEAIKEELGSQSSGLALDDVA